MGFIESRPTRLIGCCCYVIVADMSIYFDFNVGSKGTRFRRAVDCDVFDITSIIQHEHTERLFGRPDIGDLIELSSLSICMINDSKEVIGFMALSDHPNVPAVDPSDWEVWMRNLFQKYYLSCNTLFIHFMCCIDSVADIFLEEAFVSVFRNDVYLINIVFMIPPGCPKGWTKRYKTFTKHNMYKYKPISDYDVENSLCMFTATRNEFCPKLKIRRAVEEDNDDIVKLLGNNCPRLQDEYGNYYISEIIGHNTEMNRKIIVAEYQDHAVGVMCLNTEINYEMLQRTYDLTPFHGLRKATPLEKEKYKRANMLLDIFGDPIMRGKWSPFGDNTKTIQVDPQLKDKSSKRPKSASKVNFDSEGIAKRSFEHFYYPNTSEDYSEKEINSPSLSVATNPSIMNFFLDDDAFEYEIVNIDKTLLTIPEGLSCDLLSTSSFFLHPDPDKKESKSSSKRKSQIKIQQESPGPIKEVNVLKYHGGPNAFIIELFGLRDDIDDRQSINLLEAAFEINKNIDYCIIRTPCDEPSFALLQHFCFVPTKEYASCKYALYIAHRNSVFGKIRARKAEVMDIPQVSHLLQSLDGKETIWTVENTILNKNRLECFVFMSGTALIGVGILEHPEQIDFMRSKFNLDSLRLHKYHIQAGKDAGFATLKAIVVYSVFEPHYRFFARELLRLSGNNSLLWLTAYKNKWVTHKANSLAGAMIPLTPRPTEIDCTSVPELRRIRNLSKTVVAFSSWFISNKLTSVARINIDTRIIVVGASRTAMSFLNTLIFSDSSSYLFFTNVTLVSPDGLPYARRTKHASEMMFEKNRLNSDKYLKSMPYTYYVNVVQGYLIEINKKQKYITISTGGSLHYDLLFLLFGKQYQHPDYLKNILYKEKLKRRGDIPLYTRLDIPQSNPEPTVSNFTPSNVFIVNSIHDANRALNFVKSFMWQDMDYKIIVYGANKHAYCCLAALIEMKISGKNIIFVEPFPSNDSRKARVSLFCNVYVDKSVSEMIRSLHITVYRSYYFQRWHMDANDLVTRVDFMSHFKILRLKCSVFFYYGIRGVNENAFIAINKSGMAYDGGILIDHEFKTKDPSIYAAGPVTRYYRKYQADNKRQKYYDAYEVGMTLGNRIRNKLDPLFSEVKNSEKLPRNTIKNVSFDETSVGNTSFNSFGSRESRDIEVCPDLPQFKKPLVLHCYLPGGLQYLEVRPPGKKLPHYFVQSLEHNGYVMETFKDGYFKLHFTSEFIVDGVTCLSMEKYSLDNFKNLYGLSATVLNNVHLRYTTKKLDNFYEFFRAPWAFFLYHDQIDELFAMVKEVIPKGQCQGDTLAETIRNIGDSISNQSCKLTTKSKIRSRFEKSPYFEAITDYVIKWLSENDVLLPMYLQPWQTTEYDHDVDKHPVFRKRRKTMTKMLSTIF
ncbi:cilia- and flagella-associated protein 61-like [Danaus plexippus]|uniref:cilia- and flagella-associated protein 61-like n=1 Tax=Danaus plexippus TaxID=13037 RepID=UPI002AB2DA03|nr:cilia- and flagella-associated protein 61-like [Danaus plexippus]